MALWGANDNLLSPGTVSLDYSSGTVTASVGASFGFVGYGGTGDVIRFGVKGGEGGYEDYFGDAIITGITSFRVVTIGSTAGLSGASIASTDYYVSQLPKSSIVDFTFSEKNTTEQSLHVHFIDEAFAAMDVPASASGTPGSRNVPIYLGGTPGLPEGVDLKVGDTVLNDGNDLLITGVGTVVVTASAFNTGVVGVGTSTKPIGINTGSYVSFVPHGAGLAGGATLVDGANNIPITSIGSSVLMLSSATSAGIDTGDTLVINTLYGISVGSTLTADIASGENLTFKRLQLGVDRTVYGIGATVGAGVSVKPHALEYTTQGNGWVGVTTYMDCQGNLRVKSEILVAGVGIETGSNGLLYPTDLGNA